MPDVLSSFGMTGMPGANTGGTNVAVPGGATSQTPAIGGAQNPLLPQFPGGTTTPPLTSSIAALNPSQSLNAGQALPNADQFVSDLKQTGLTSAQGHLLYNFLMNGAGWNPDVANAMIAAMQPGIQKGQADILEQFSTQGLRGGSPAALAYSDYMGQVQLNEGAIFSQLYEQAVQNYMSVLIPSSTRSMTPSGTSDSLQWLTAIATLGQNARTNSSSSNGSGH